MADAGDASMDMFMAPPVDTASEPRRRVLAALAEAAASRRVDALLAALTQAKEHGFTGQEPQVLEVRRALVEANAALAAPAASPPPPPPPPPPQQQQQQPSSAMLIQMGSSEDLLGGAVAPNGAAPPAADQSTGASTQQPLFDLDDSADAKGLSDFERLVGGAASSPPQQQQPQPQPQPQQAAPEAAAWPTPAAAPAEGPGSFWSTFA